MYLKNKINAVINLMKQKDDDYRILDKIYVYVKDPNMVSKNGLENMPKPKYFTKYSNNMRDVY